MAKYLMRFDDINPMMDWKRFLFLKKILEKYNIKSILGVVPDCKDKNLFYSKPFREYYEFLRKYKSFGDTIAQHGFTHIYDSKSKGIFGSSKNSEFAGHSYKMQLKKLKSGKEILNKEYLWDPVFMAPGHSFDKNSIKALESLNFNIILDGFALFPFRKNKITFIPQISSRPLPLFLPCVSQLCIHINTISDKEFFKLIDFIDNNHDKFIKLDDIKIKFNFLKLFDKFIIYLIVKVIRIFRSFKKLSLNYLSKFLCLYQRFYFNFRLRNLNIYDWHLKGTFYCREYKKISLNIINSLKPNIYIDIGCGLGEILSRVDLNPKYKYGYDIDLSLKKANYLLHKEKYNFYLQEENLLNNVKRIDNLERKLILVSMLNFAHTINPEKLKQILGKYYEFLGKYILLIDNINIDKKEYKYDHHEFLFNHSGMFKYFHNVDKLRSLYCIKIEK